MSWKQTSTLGITHAVILVIWRDVLCCLFPGLSDRFPLWCKGFLYLHRSLVQSWHMKCLSPLQTLWLLHWGLHRWRDRCRSSSLATLQQREERDSKSYTHTVQRKISRNKVPAFVCISLPDDYAGGSKSTYCDRWCNVGVCLCTLSLFCLSFSCCGQTHRKSTVTSFTPRFTAFTISSDHLAFCPSIVHQNTFNMSWCTVWTVGPSLISSE